MNHNNKILAHNSKWVKPYQYPEDAFVFTIRTTIPDETFTLPTVSGQTYDAIVIQEGIGKTVVAYDDANITHTYAKVGYHQVVITGKFGGWSFNNAGDKLKITSVDQWGDIGFDYIVSGFHGCTNLSQLPISGSISATTSVTSIATMFRSTSIIETYSGMFDLCTEATNGTNLFFACYQLTTIPADLLEYNIKLTTLGGMFLNCFDLGAIPVDLFRYNVLVTNVSGIFNACTSITTVPIDLFRYNTLITLFATAFFNCSGLTTIPTDLFRYNLLVTSFSLTFNGCTSLTNIPEGIFYYNTLVANYASTFSLCRNIILPSVIFNTANLSIVTTFNNFMQAASVGYSHTGTIQDIWNYATSAISTNAFLNQTDLDNYADIPPDWKGL